MTQLSGYRVSGEELQVQSTWEEGRPCRRQQGVGRSYEARQHQLQWAEDGARRSVRRNRRRSRVTANITNTPHFGHVEFHVNFDEAGESLSDVGGQDAGRTGGELGADA